MSFAYPQVVDYNQPRGRALSWDGVTPPVPGYGAVHPEQRYYESNQPAYQPGWGTGGWGVGGMPQYTAAPAYAPQVQPQVLYGTYGTYGAPQPAPVTNSQVCCPLPGPQENPVPSQSAHAFASNAPAGQCEGLVSRNVEYQTEWVAVPVQKPVVYETYQRVVEIPTQHLVNVQNVPGHVPPRQCDPSVQGYSGFQPAVSTSPVPWAGGPMGGRSQRTFSF